MSQPLKISACMIVKNEEKLLPNCLKSIRSHVDEIVVVDTGSTDGTVSIAESFGARVYHHPWEHHFSKHRNQSLDYATGDWLFIIDADEELLPLKGLSLHQALDVGEDIDSALVRVECPSPSGLIHANSVRFIRNRPHIRYKGRVHNYLEGIEKSLFLEIRLFHHGYNLGKEVDRHKFERTTELLKRDIEEDPENPRPHHFLAASYLAERMYRPAAESAEKAIDLFEKKRMVPHNYLWSLYIAAASRHNLGEDEKAEGHCLKAISFFPDHLDSHFILSGIYMKKDDSALFRKHRDAYLAIHKEIETDPSRFGEIVHNSFGALWLVNLWSGVMALSAGSPAEAEDHFQRSRDLCGSELHFHLELARVFWTKNMPGEAEKEYWKVLELDPGNTEQFLELGHLLERSGQRRKQRSALEKFLVQTTPDRGLLLALAPAYLEWGHPEIAASLFQQVLDRDPHDPEARINLGLCLVEMGKFEKARRIALGYIEEGGDLLLPAYRVLGLSEYYGGDLSRAFDAFIEMTHIDPDLVEPYVYLSRIALEKADIETCILYCDNLLRLLNLERDIVLHSLPELGTQFVRIAESLTARSAPALARVCLDTARVLAAVKPPADPSPAFP
ncbi:MAG: glycosyltransferase [Deltaproteobacteria bacterium]|nr:glycosyltransferase [Deltaproteobacteria bacterium]MBW2304405.1 glycosyltransferase [Deltaproteobacteria bacterium]